MRKLSIDLQQKSKTGCKCSLYVVWRRRCIHIRDKQARTTGKTRKNGQGNRATWESKRGDGGWGKGSGYREGEGDESGTRGGRDEMDKTETCSGIS